MSGRDQVDWKHIRAVAFVLILIGSAALFAVLFPDLKPRDPKWDAIAVGWVIGLTAIGAALKAIARPLRCNYLKTNPALEQSLKRWSIFGVCLLSALVTAAVVQTSLAVNF